MAASLRVWSEPAGAGRAGCAGLRGYCHSLRMAASLWVWVEPAGAGRAGCAGLRGYCHSLRMAASLWVWSEPAATRRTTRGCQDWYDLLCLLPDVSFFRWFRASGRKRAAVGGGYMPSGLTSAVTCC